ncbi:YcxB family protein [Gottfriedia solisilvae]|uniref:YcxB-like C-terminal domain-containing protein n=1 Tax=Gottfriedia solisilvae TaxID=1516104 RepID=A0A8J3ASR5_9BACI|nr:YcxB family protein [Gottfriedia solisilvae]GGI17985.1 hypothetical protein GCM10007380_40670 [Gottfriedia solisilvae]
MDDMFNEKSGNTIISVELEPKDYFWFALHYLKRMYRFILFSIFLFLLGIYTIIEKGLSLKLIILFLPFIFIILILLSPLYTGKHNAAKHGKRTYTIHENGLSFISEEIEGSFKWSAIVKVLKTKRYIYLFLSSNSALIFPTRIFSGEQLTVFEGFIPSNSKGKQKSKISTLNKIRLVVFLFFISLMVLGVFLN